MKQKQRWPKLRVSYKKLWKLLIDRDMKKKNLHKVAGLSSTTITKLSNQENISMNVLKKICSSLNRDIGDIMELILNENTP